MANKPHFLSKNGLLYYWTQMKNLLSGKVDKQIGKGLSTNDYSDAEKAKLTNIASGAQVNIIEQIKVNNTAVGIDNKSVNITVPTNNNQLTNGAGYQTSSDVQSAISSAISQITSFEFSLVNSLPQQGERGVIYLIAHTHDGQNDGFDEYIYITVNNVGTWEKLGHTDVDLSGYVEINDVITNAEIDEILAS